jgi:CHAD domain-containing protein
MADQHYAMNDPNTREAVAAELAGLFDGIRETTVTDRFEVLDSFDWRLFKSGRLLFKTDEYYATVDLHTGRTVNTLAVGLKKPLAFCWDFPESELAAELENALEMRALISLGTVGCVSVQQDLLNKDEKIVARLAMETFRLDQKEAEVHQYRVSAVRGYPKSAKQIAACLEKVGVKPARRSPVLKLLVDCGFRPGDYSSKINIELSPKLPAAEALRRIMAQLVAVMRLNLPGVRDDIDSEFLHDFRVSVRRARSLLSQLKGVLDAETTAELQQRLKAMGAITGNVRDLDVYLLKREECTGMVGDDLKPGIALLFRALQNKRRYAKNRMVKLMAAEMFAADMAFLDAFAASEHEVETEREAGAPLGDRPIGGVARTVIYKRYRRIIKKGGRITEETPDEDLHSLRIDCKKLRYLLEFFTALFPKEQMKMLIKQLKQLQENLGDFNDLSVQQEFLVQYLKGIKPQSSQSVMLAAAVGGLITRLGMEHQRVRDQFLDVFARFNSKENRKLFKTLFA